MNAYANPKNDSRWTIFGTCLTNAFWNSIRVPIFQKIKNPSTFDDYRHITVLVVLDWTLSDRILHGYAYETKSVEVTHNHPKNA
jgi:hypothetical protein